LRDNTVRVRSNAARPQGALLAIDIPREIQGHDLAVTVI